MPNHDTAERFRFDAGPGVAGRVRRWIRPVLAGWGADGSTPELALIATELTTNAVRYGRGPIDVVVRRTADTIRIEVTDRGEGVVEMPPPRPELDVRGRGLLLVQALAEAWGVARAPGTKTVWAVCRINHAE